jgi:hypothetical protein
MAVRKERESLYKLRSLVEYLEDRDLGLKRDASLFEAVFNDFPIPVTIWLSDEKGLCVSRKVTGRASSGWSTPPPSRLAPPSLRPASVIDLYDCSILQSDVERYLETALSGRQVSFLSSGNGTYVWTRLTPRFTEEGNCCGVIGASWDLTANYRMFSTLQKISTSSCDSGDLEFDALKAEAHEAAQLSIIRCLIEEAEK